MTQQSCVVEWIATRSPGYPWTCKAAVDEAAPQSRRSARRSLPGSPRRSTKNRGARENILYCPDSRGCQRANCPRRVWPYASAPTAVTRGMSIELRTLAIYLLTPLINQRDLRTALGVSLKRVRRLASRSFGQFRQTAQSRASFRRRSTPKQLVDSRYLSTGLVSAELRQGLLATQISPLNREVMMPPPKRRLVNFRGAVDTGAEHRQGLHRPSRSLPVAVVAKRHGCLPSGAADIGHLPPPLDRARAQTDLQSLISHAAPYRR
jgi:hypothetical protein